MKALPILLVAALLTGCKSIPQLNTNSSPEPETTLLEQARLDWGMKSDQKLTPLDPEKSVVEWRRKDRTVARIKSIEKQLNKRLDLLLAQIPEYPSKPRVYIGTSATFNAEALPDGGIFIPVGVLAQVEYSEEIDALLAHELSHYILNHHNSETVKNVSSNLLGKATLFSKDVNVYASIGSSSILEMTVFNLWNESEELDADKMGVDLLISAGINPNAMFLVMKKLNSYADVQKSTSKTAAVNLGPESAQEEGSYSFSDMADFSDKLVSTVSQSMGISSHGDGKERLKETKQYVRKFHTKRPRGRLTASTYKDNRSVDALFKLNVSAKELVMAGELDKASRLGLKAISGELSENSYSRFVMFLVRALQDEDAKANKNLTIALNSPDAPRYIYYTLLMGADKRKDKEQVMQYASLINKEFDNPVSFMPDQIHFMHKYGYDEKAINRRVLKCAALGDNRYYDQCTRAAKGKLYK